MDGWYYLHENGDMIFKRDLDDTVADFRDSDFVKAFWPLDTTNRETAWRMLVEGLSAEAKRERVFELAQKWGCDDEDAAMYAEFIKARLTIDGNAWMASREDFIDLMQSPAGFGDTALEALAELCTELGYRPSNMWGNTFAMVLVA